MCKPKLVFNSNPKLNDSWLSLGQNVSLDYSYFSGSELDYSDKSILMKIKACTKRSSGVSRHKKAC